MSGRLADRAGLIPSMIHSIFRHVTIPLICPQFCRTSLTHIFALSLKVFDILVNHKGLQLVNNTSHYSCILFFVLCSINFLGELQ